MIYLAPSPGIAGLKGRDLLESCKGAITYFEKDSLPSDTVSRDTAELGSICISYISGILDTLIFDNTVLKIRLFCIPKDITSDQAIRVIVKYLEDHPEQLNDPAIILVLTAFKTYFPCNNQK